MSTDSNEGRRPVGSPAVADPEVAVYARQVREALADVPAARLEELLEDLEEHLLEVAAESSEPLTDRLGPAGEYAAELRRAAGLTQAAPAMATPGWNDRLLQLWSEVEASTGWTRLVDFLPELRPAWWVVRGWAAVAVVHLLFVGRNTLPVPTLGLGPLGWVVTGAAIVWSVRIGLRNRAAARPLGRPALVATLILAACSVAAVVAAVEIPAESNVQTVYYDDGPPTLTHEDGTPITNIVPFTSDGEPLTGVLLYDQDGRPIDNLSDYTGDGEQVTTAQTEPPQPANAYPRTQVVTSYDEFGNEVSTTTAPTAAETPEPSAPATEDAPQPTSAPAPPS